MPSDSLLPLDYARPTQKSDEKILRWCISPAMRNNNRDAVPNFRMALAIESSVAKIAEPISVRQTRCRISRDLNKME
jgi:hypothetical protein